MTGLGHRASAAATIATASSSDGAGDITMPDGGGSSFSDTRARVSDDRVAIEAVVQPGALTGRPHLAFAADDDASVRADRGRCGAARR